MLPSLMLSSWLFLMGSAFIAGLARGFSGFGAALIFVPLGSAAIGPQLAVPMLLIVDGFSALGLIPRAWRLGDKREVATMMSGALIGIPFGTWLLVKLDPTVMRWLIVGLIIVLLGLLASGWRYVGRPKAPTAVSVGCAAGIMGGLAQASGPPVIAFWLGRDLPPAIARANLILFFAASTVVSAISFTVGGLLTLKVLVLALVAIPIYGLGLYLGSLMFGRASERVFRRACYSLIGLAALISMPVLDDLIR